MVLGFLFSMDAYQSLHSFPASAQDQCSRLRQFLARSPLPFQAMLICSTGTVAARKGSSYMFSAFGVHSKERDFASNLRH